MPKKKVRAGVTPHPVVKRGLGKPDSGLKQPRRKVTEKKVTRTQRAARERGHFPDEIAVDIRLEATGKKTQPRNPDPDWKISAPDEQVFISPDGPIDAAGRRDEPWKDEKGSKTTSKHAAAGSLYPATGMVCDRCNRRRPKNHFQQHQRNPVVYDSVCKACRIEERTGDARAANLDRAAQRQAKAEYQAMVKEEARRKAERKREDYKLRASKKGATEEAKHIAGSVQREIARRELARRKLLYFTQRFEGQKVDESGELVEVERAKGKGYVAEWVHKDVCARLERFLKDMRAGLQPRLMIFMPPRHGKSTLASRMFPAWALGQDPTIEVIAASYGSALPETFSRSVRGILRDEEYQAIFPKTRMDPERENVQGWATTENGMYIPAGVGSGISGKGADILLIDDPFKGAEDAENPNAREKVIDWYFSEALTRLSPRAGVLIILTRWHDADLAGALLASQDEQEKESREILEAELAEIRDLSKDRGRAAPDALSKDRGRAAPDALSKDRGSAKDRPSEDKDDAPKLPVDFDRVRAEALAYAEHKERLRDVETWEVVSYAAIADDDEYRLPDGRLVHAPRQGATLLRHKGEALHPARYPLERLRRIRKGLYARGRQRFWHALYQQKPVPDEGIHFSRGDIVIVQPPSAVQRHHWTRLSAWDLAAGQKQQHDYTVGIGGAIDHDGNIWVLELVRGRFDGAHGVATQVLDEYERSRPYMIAVERGPLEQFLMPSIKKELEDRNKGRNHKDRLLPIFGEKEYAWTPINDPVMTARPLQSIVQQKKLFFSKDLVYQEEMIQELIRFPGAVHDDIVMALAGFVRLALKFNAPRQPTIKERRKSWKDRLSGYVKGAGLGPMAA